MKTEKNSTQTFLEELYEIDPDLRSHEAELIPLVKKLLKQNPGTAPDADFVAHLRMQLRDHAAELTTSPASGWQKILFALGGAVTAAVILPLAFIAWNQSPSNVPSNTGAPLFTYNVQDTGAEAFGPLSDVPLAQEQPVRNQSGGGGGPSAALGINSGVAASPAYPGVAPTAVLGTDAGISSKMMYPYPMVRTNYVYDGDLKDLAATVSVFKKQLPSGRSIPLSTVASSLNLGTLDISSFDNVKIDSLSFTQDIPFGYQVTVNMRDSSVYLDANWMQWPQSKCTTDACYQAERVKIGDIPADPDLIAIADNFIKDHGIDLSHYGTPVVNNEWRVEYDRAANTSLAYVPDTMNVTYPLQIEGKDVYDQGGTKTGLNVSVNVKYKKVMGIYGIMDRTYLKSDYAGVTDAQQIKDFIAKMDNYPIGIMERTDGGDTTVKTNTVTLGEPTISYAMYYRYDNATSEELLVPSLVFPVKEVSGDTTNSFYRRTVVVPLAADMLKEQMIQPPIMPLDGVKAM